MRMLHRLAALALLGQALPVPAHGAPQSSYDAREGRAFADDPVGNDVLGSVVGMGPLAFARNVRPVADPNMILVLQQFGQTSRVAIDNWWVQTGAVLIINNQLAARN